MELLDLSGYTIETLREGGEFDLYRGRAQDGAASILLSTVNRQQQDVASAARLEHEYALASELESTWALRPLALTEYQGRRALVLEDPGGQPLKSTLGRPFELAEFLRTAVAISTALGQVHRRGLVHNDIRPENVLLDTAGTARVTGFGIASRPPSGPRGSELAGSLAYVAPEQTGRINRAVDSRSDLYSLGITFYEMLTGGLPFTASEPLEWIHCHIAREPAPPGERVDSLPAAVEAIVLKLLRKNAEDRYQTAAALQADLSRCLQALQVGGRVEPFAVGEQDVSKRFAIGEKLYGREAEAQALIEALRSLATDGASRVVLLSGQPGIGKSAILKEVRRKLASEECLFTLGKAEQYGQNTPHGTLVQALQGLVRPLLLKKEGELANLRALLLEALGSEGQLIATAIPELALILGEQPSTVERPARDAQDRFYGVVRRFLGIFARPERPLLLGLDDLQWLDLPTLELVERLVTDPAMEHLLLVGTYRDSAVDASHPLMQALERMRKSPTELTELALAPLVLADVEQLVADGMGVELPQVRRLAEFVFEKTGGNPFFTIQFVTALADEGLLVFNPKRATWQWDVGRMRAEGISADLASVVNSKLQRLSDDTKQVLTRMALLGGTAEFSTLVQVSSDSGTDPHAALRDALQAGLVVRDDDSYRFVHDRIHEAAYSLIGEEERAAAHLAIGRSLVAQKTAAELGEKIFEIVSPFEQSSALVHSREERDRVAELNLFAGRRARAAAAYASALAYFETGLAWLGPDAWERCPGLTLELELQRGTCEFLIGALAAAKEHLAAISRRPLALVELPALVDIEVKVYTHSGESGRAVENCLGYLQRFDLALPPHPTQAELGAEYEGLKEQLEGRAISSLIDLPPMIDPEQRARIDVLASLMAPSGHFDQKLTALTMMRMVRLSLEHGNCDPSCAAYVGMAQFLGPLFGDYRRSYAFGALAVELVETRGLTRYMSRVFGSYGIMALPWLKHIREGYAFAKRASEVPAERDLPTYSCYAWWARASIRLDCGDRLDEVHAEAQTALAFVSKLEFAFAVDLVTAPLRLTRTLMGLTPRFGSLEDDTFSEAPYEQYLEANRLLTHATVRYWIRKLQARFHADDYAGALAAAAKAQKLLAATLRTFEFAEYHLYAALAHAALASRSDPTTADLDAINAHRAQLQAWAEDCPANFGGRAALVGAEIARLTGHELEAERLYEEAIQLSRQYGFVQIEALGSELASRFYAARGLHTIASAYLLQARGCYGRWGAYGKVRHLDERRTEAGGATLSPSSGPVDAIDLGAILKVSQALSGEILLDNLIETLMRLVIQHAGAERGSLILLRGGGLQVAAEVAVASDSVLVTHRKKAISPADLPAAAIDYVIRTRKSLILDDAHANGPLAEDEYVQRHRPKSLLCMPILKQAELVGVLYLQNSLTAQAFTPSRISVLEFLASQAAISLQNAYLYADLRQSEAFLAEGQRLSHTASWRFNVVTGEVRWSEEHYRIFDWDSNKDPVPTWGLAILKVHHEDRPYLEQAFDAARRERRGLAFEFRLDLGHSLKYLQGVGRPVFDESGEVESFVGTTMDVTERRHAEDALRNAREDLAHANRLTTMGELAASIAHEINQPLSAIATSAASCVTWLGKDPPNLGRASAAAERIARDTERAGEIIRSLRSMARRTPPEMRQLDVDHLIQEVLDLLRTELHRHEVQVTTELTGLVPPIFGDRVQLQQVIVNLVTNGIEAMKGVEGQRALRVARHAGPDHEVVIAVEDSGTGVEKAVLDRIFDPLFTTKREGLGMGLAICRSIVETHGGRLWVSPRLPHGSIFSFSVPSSRAR